ncbi:MAG TPA: LysR family transcriptional regulator [Sulfuricaulis sp.]|nr:LysR family transcriptional regulator [Sulfuricaulis sp.]
MNWDDLRIFLAVARMSSVSGAARYLGVQHSTVSRRLRQLEKRLGTRLFEKKRTGYELTAAGEDLKQASMNMEREALAVDGALRGQDKNLAGSLRVTAVNIMAAAVLAPIFSRFNAAHPEIELQILVCNSDISLAERQADVALRVTNDPVETLMGKKIATIASTVYGGRKYLADLRKHDAPPKWIGMTCCGYHKHWTSKLSGGEPHQVIVDDPIMTQQMLKQNMGLAVLPCYMADPDPLLERYTDPIPEMDMGLWFLFHSDLKRTERIHVFRDFLIKEIEGVRDLLEGNQA